jgi:Domain of unknown function (DUF4157)
VSESGFDHKGPGAVPGSASDVDADVLPGRAPRDPIAPASRYQTIVDERTRAAASIRRRMAVWRKASGPAKGGGGAIPEATGSLDDTTRGRMEHALGGKLGDVKVGTSGASAAAASQLGARAFAVGNQVHFGAGQFAPGTRDGDKLLAHELTHVMQGQNAGVQRKAEEGAAHGHGDDAHGHGAAGGEHGAAGGEHGAAGGEHGAAGQKVSEEHEPAEQEAEEHSKKAENKLHGGEGAAGEHKDAGAGEHGQGEKPKQAAPDVGAKLFRKIYLGGRQAKPKPAAKPLPQVDPAVRQEMDAIKAYIEKEAQKAKTKWSAAAAPLGTVMVLAGKGAAVGTGAGPVGTMVGAAAGAVVGALVSIFGIGHKKHKIMEEKAKLLDNLDLLIHQPEVIHELCDYCTALAPDLKTLEAKIAAAVEEISNKKKKLALRDKKAQDKKAPPPPKPNETQHKIEHGAHKAHTGAEIAEATAETGAAATEAGAHVAGEAAAHVLEQVTPVLEGAAHVAQGVGVAVGAVVAGLDYKTFRDKQKKYEELKKKLDTPTPN